MKVTPTLIADISKSFDDQGTQDLVEAIRAELKKDLRKSNLQGADYDGASELIDNLDNPHFWYNLDWLLNNFTFDF